MKVVDANVLLYAVNEDSPHHSGSKDWLDGALSGADTVGFPWLVLLAFLRLATKSAVFPTPLTTEEALEQVESWLAAPTARVVHPSPTHANHLRLCLQLAGTGGNLVSDAHIAALAIEHKADVVTYDADFERFGVGWSTPDRLAAD